MENKKLLDKIKDKAKRTTEGLKRQYSIGSDGPTWPQTKFEPVSGSSGLNLYPNHKTKGFLPPISIPPLLQTNTYNTIDNNSIELGGSGVEFNTLGSNEATRIKTYGEYKYKDWRGHQLNLNTSTINTKDKFEESKTIKKNKNSLSNSPHSTRDVYLAFNDNSTDYFKHGLQVIDNLTPIENPENGISNIRLDNFNSTPFEKSDPIIYGFEIIIDDVSSPLLNGSISDFIRNYSNISEVSSKEQVYEEFKQQFVKFFKTKATVRIEEPNLSMTKMREASYPESDSSKTIFQNGKKSYMSYYLNKIEGLANLIERNTPKEKKFLTDYNQDIITLAFNEDVSLSVGTLAHLYKLLYWSKPNGKGIIPENLLRFNCDIIVSEVRNFNRVRRATETGELQVIKDNVSRYVYSLKECQLYFNSMPHNTEINMSEKMNPFPQASYAVQFDYKYSSSKLERFVPTRNGLGEYMGYDSGAIWKVGNVGERDNRESSQESRIDSSVPNFFTIGDNKFNENGVKSPFIFSYPGDTKFKKRFQEPSNESEESEELSLFEKFKQSSLTKAKQLKDRLEDVAIQSASMELQTFINTRTAILNKTLNKILNSKSGPNSIRPPRNIYTDDALNAGQRIFYDVRGELINFLGNSAADALGGGGFTGGGLSQR